jgi:DNA primase
MDYSNKITCADVKEVSIVGFLSSLGHEAKKISGDTYWYSSPLRNERTPSFKVSVSKNLWYDHGVGKGGTLIDFGLLFYHCSIGELLEKLSHHFSFHPHLLSLRTNVSSREQITSETNSFTRLQHRKAWKKNTKRPLKAG